MYFEHSTYNKKQIKKIQFKKKYAWETFLEHIHKKNLIRLNQHGVISEDAPPPIS